MKSLARSYFWWPNIDKDIEVIAKGCDICIMHKPEPLKVVLTKWPRTYKCFDRIHIDYAGPIMNKMFLIISDSFSKWPEIFKVKKADTSNTLIKFKKVFARFGLPNTIVTDNGTPFTSTEFSDFCQYNGIKHLTISPYHPSRILPILPQIKLRLKLCLGEMLLHEEVFIRDYTKPNQRGWKVCSIVESLGRSVYLCKDQTNDSIHKRHVDQIIKSGIFYNEVFNESLNETFEDGGSNIVKDKVTDSNKETYHSETPEPSSTRIKRKCILPARYRSN
ncbi:uncharacterized protein K02A2.6-like [Myzus persicae]|uniref:uncharacterized protein K02A2.6-like n=1 Tax=Myzus persicae TaxID=13164 RepID=UPI000B9305F0|nr:uncharacterized protein K02A2.6-like [Myzus persicae]